jgi:lysozyme family protein
MGISGGAKLLQKTLGVKEDGIIGPITLSVLETAGEISQRYIDNRENFYIQLVQNKPSQKVFLDGWLNRVNDLRKYIS